MLARPPRILPITPYRSNRMTSPVGAGAVAPDDLAPAPCTCCRGRRRPVTSGVRSLARCHDAVEAKTHADGLEADERGSSLDASLTSSCDALTSSRDDERGGDADHDACAAGAIGPGLAPLKAPRRARWAPTRGHHTPRLERAAPRPRCPPHRASPATHASTRSPRRMALARGSASILSTPPAAAPSSASASVAAPARSPRVPSTTHPAAPRTRPAPRSNPSGACPRHRPHRASPPSGLPPGSNFVPSW